MKPTLGTMRDLDIMQLEGEAYALEIYNEFMGELYGKRQRPDQSGMGQGGGVVSQIAGAIAPGSMGGGNAPGSVQANPPYQA